MEKTGYVSNKYPYTTLMTWEFYKHRHAFWELVICVSGEAAHFVNDGKFNICAGDVLIMKPDSVHDYKILSDKYAHYDFYVSINAMKSSCDFIASGYYEILSADKLPAVLHTDGNTAAMLENSLSRLNSLQLSPQFAKSAKILYKTLLQFFSGMLIEQYENRENDRPKWLSDIMSEMSSPNNLTSDLKSIIEKSGYSHSHLCRLFKKYTGEKLLDYFTKLKIDYSAVLLTNKDMNILEISSYLGYDSVSHFINLFKKYYGVTPHRYRSDNYL